MRQIKYIVHTISSYNDYYGNTYHFARITRTTTGKSLVIDGVGGSDNAAHLLVRKRTCVKPLVRDWSEIYLVQTWEKKREWQRLEKFARGYDGTNPTDAVPEYKVTPAMIRALSSSAVPEYTGG